MKSLAFITAAVLGCVSSVLGATDKNNLTKPASSEQILSGAFKPPQVFKNSNLVRIINLEKGYPKETVNVIIENVASSPQDEYFLPFTATQMENIGVLEVKDRKNVDSPLFEVEAVEIDPESDIQFYRIRLPAPLAPGAQQTLGINYAFLSSLYPLPATINQQESQFLVYDTSAYAPSAYPTLKQKTEIKFPSTNIKEHTVIPGKAGESDSPQKQGSKFTYGPFEDIPAGAVESISVRYEFTKPLINVSKLERDIEVSHWGGNVAFEDRYTLHNRAANLTKQFDRVQWASTQYYNPPTTAIKSLTFPLRVGSLDPYYTDTIGNVSTSKFRSNKREALLELKPRYPIFGGWNYPFRVGWNADSTKFLRKLKSGDGFVLNVPFLEGPKQNEGITYEDVELRVILPEGATNVDYYTTVPLTSTTITTHKTYMDTLGRTTLVLRARNINDDLRDRELIVTYNYPFLAGLRKPLVIFSGMLAIFATAYVVGSLDTRIAAKKRN